jgi:Zn-dependent peptidase ImmA (M78 family)
MVRAAERQSSDVKSIMNVTIQPELLVWARNRASLDLDDLARKVGTAERPAPILEWERTGVLPLKKLERLAEKTHAPLGMLFLPEPPDEPLPIRDFRLGAGTPERRPSLGLLETIYSCQLRQAWMSERMQSAGANPLDFIGSASVSDDPIRLAHSISDHLRIGTSERSKNATVADATLWMMARLEEAGILVQRNGVVGNQTRRPLDPREFKAFALCDQYAPLIFINGKDWHASQMFSIAHECVHLWLGESALPDGDWFGTAGHPVDRFCDRVAAEILMPGDEVRANWWLTDSPIENARRLRKFFHVSGLAVLVRGRTLSLLSEQEFLAARNQEDQAFAETASDGSSSGGNYYNTAGTRLGKRFIREVLVSTLEGRTSYSEAFDLLGTHRTEVFNGLVKKFLQGETP